MPNLVKIATETMDKVERAQPPLRGLIDRAVAGTELIEKVPRPVGGGAPARIEVTGETTAAAARRLFGEGKAVAALNFASAVNPGGGFVRGAKAQEEDLCRCSALYACLVTQPDYYQRGRADTSSVYPDLFMWSPEVPFFRDDTYGWVDPSFQVSILTAAAPNAYKALAADAGARAKILAAIEQRAELVLSLFAAKGAKHVVLGAWGCGAFGNDPVHMAETLGRLLPGFPFDHVVFAVYDRQPGQPNLNTFRAQFG